MIERLTAQTRPARQNLKREAETYLRDLIHSGELKPGQRLDQDGIAAELGFSRLPVREALITLEAEGLVENFARRGAFVAHIEPDDIQDHYRMYGAISGIAAARVAETRSDDLVAQLEQLNNEMRDAADGAEYDRLNFHFHRTINRAGGSRRLLAVLRILSSSMPTDYFQHNTDGDYHRQTIDEHDSILRAIRDRDPEAATRHLEVHFAHTGEQAVRLLRTAGFWDRD